MNNLTSIQLQKKTLSKLKEFRDYRRETYDELLNKLMRIIEALEKKPMLKKEVIEEVEEARREFREGKGISTAQLVKELGIKI